MARQITMEAPYRGKRVILHKKNKTVSIVNKQRAEITVNCKTWKQAVYLFYHPEQLQEAKGRTCEIDLTDKLREEFRLYRENFNRYILKLKGGKL